MVRETLVMLPGMMCDERLFAHQIAVLKENYHIIVPKLNMPATIEGMARRTLAEVEAPIFNLLGLSMGGIVAMSMVTIAPQRIRRLALLDTSHLADSPERITIRNRQIEDVKAGKLRQVFAEEMKPIYLAKANRKNRILLSLLIDMALDMSADTFIVQSLALRDRAEHSATLSNFRGPTVLLCGAEDSLCPPSRHQEMLGLFENAALNVIENCGHISTLEQPTAVTRVLLKWLDLTCDNVS